MNCPLETFLMPPATFFHSRSFTCIASAPEGAASQSTNQTTNMKICIQTLGIMIVAASLSYGQDGPKKGHKPPNPEAAFKKLDANSDASVSLEEFKASPRAQKNAEKAEEIFKKIDADSSGGVSFEEFKAHRPAHPPRKHKKPGEGEGQ
jgi:hypothetical protein